MGQLLLLVMFCLSCVCKEAKKTAAKQMHACDAFLNGVLDSVKARAAVLARDR
jgi:hypothetical protein